MPKSHSVNGMIYFFKGFKWLTKPGLKRFIVIPIIINIIFYSFFFITGFYGFAHLANLLPQWLHWLRWLFWIIFFLAGSIILIYTFTLFANLIAAPFNSLLSEKVEQIVTQQKIKKEEGLKSALKDFPRTIKREWDKIKYYIPRAIFLLVLFFIPGINIIASILWFVFGCWMMAVEYVDYPLDNHKTSFKELHLYLRQHRLACFSFGLSVTVVSMIPIINFFVMPAAVIGGTLMFLDQQ